MSARFTMNYNTMVRRLLTDVEIASALDMEKRTATTFRALWDTGATSSVITKSVVEKLGLTLVSKRDVATASGLYVASMYYISLKLPNNVVIPKLLVSDGILTGCDVLIGMDVISMGDLVISNFEGKTSFSFRIPSEGRMDFVHHSYKAPVVKTGIQIGRNSPCPCGSGLKYKNCCGKAV